MSSFDNEVVDNGNSASLTNIEDLYTGSYSIPAVSFQLSELGHLGFLKQLLCVFQAL